MIHRSFVAVILLLTCAMAHAQETRLVLTTYGFSESSVISFLENDAPPSFLDDMIIEGTEITTFVSVATADVDLFHAAVQNRFVSILGLGVLNPRYRLHVDLEITPDSSSPTLLPSPPANNASLDTFLPLSSAPLFTKSVKVPGKVRVNIIGTGIDESHPELSSMNFVPGLSVMPNPDFFSPMPNLDPSIDYHNHETALAASIAGQQTGLLPRLGTFPDLEFRSVLTYDLPQPNKPASAFSSDSSRALNELIFDQQDRQQLPYLKNHAALICYAHSVSQPGARDGLLELMFDRAWDNEILTILSAGNRGTTAAIASPAGVGEAIVYQTTGGFTVTARYWPPHGTFSTNLPQNFGLNSSHPRSFRHLKIGAVSASNSSLPWSVSPTLGSNINTARTGTLGDPTNNGVDLFTAGENVVTAASVISLDGNSTDLTLDGQTYKRTRAYQQISGTSLSAAYATAVATAIYSHNPWASPPQIRKAMLDASNATDTPGTTTPNFHTLSLPTSIPHITLTFNEWHARYQKLDPLLKTSNRKLSDEDGDGVSNLLEYFCGMDPRHQDAHLAPRFEVDETTQSVKATFQKAAYLPSTTDWTIEQCGDLQSWTSIGKGQVSELPITPQNGDGTTQEVTLPLTVTNTDNFYRLAITIQ